MFLYLSGPHVSGSEGVRDFRALIATPIMGRRMA
jgi:hypothetical protein